jgi:type IV secretory pathway VirB4 component
MDLKIDIYPFNEDINISNDLNYNIYNSNKELFDIISKEMYNEKYIFLNKSQQSSILKIVFNI